MKKTHPESLMMSYGYQPKQSAGAIKAPLFQTSTFAFQSAEEGKAFFEVAYGLREKQPDEEMGMIYSRINNPNLEILEQRLSLWDKADQCAVFQSGMAAISTVMLEFLKPGDLVLFSQPVYGGTDHFINYCLKDMNVDSIGFTADQSFDEIIDLVENSGKADRLSLIYVESPANPTNDLFDIEMCSAIKSYFETKDKKIFLAVDNTFMGPVWSSPLELGADLVIYSATKYIGGHSDLIAGAVLGDAETMIRIKTLRTFLGNMASPHTCWLLMRSLETLKVRMEQQARNAQAIAKFLNNHPIVKKVHYLGLLDKDSKDYSIFKKQYTSPGAMIAFEIDGNESEAFRFLNHLQLIKLAVSLGSTESLVQHPASMTHAGMDPELRDKIGITESLIRLSVGLENHEDLIRDIVNALEMVKSENNSINTLERQLVKAY
ncbi:MAG: cystathionine gamma-synthase family protein [Bacteroidia bacterium]|nr:cystathionine gamma-synthase family protein [Bacteroidia bacterium]